MKHFPLPLSRIYLNTISLGNDLDIPDDGLLVAFSGTMGVDAGFTASGELLFGVNPLLGLLFAVGTGVLTMVDPNWSTTAGKCIAGYRPVSNPTNSGSQFCGRNR